MACLPLLMMIIVFVDLVPQTSVLMVHIIGVDHFTNKFAKVKFFD